MGLRRRLFELSMVTLLMACVSQEFFDANRDIEEDRDVNNTGCVYKESDKLIKDNPEKIPLELPDPNCLPDPDCL